MAWNVDGTRMPCRQHSEVPRRLYVDNELFQGKYLVGGRAISISNIHCPMLAVAAVADHVAPWHSVYRLHLQSDATELTFVLTSGGHNVGIVNEPGHPCRRFQMATCKEGERCPRCRDLEGADTGHTRLVVASLGPVVGAAFERQRYATAHGRPGKGLAAFVRRA